MSYLKRFSAVLLLFLIIFAGCCPKDDGVQSTADKLKAWRTGVWITGNGTYTIYTPDHYFVLSMEGDTADANLYYGASQVSYHNAGMARYQVERLRKSPGGEINNWIRPVFTENHTETPLKPDTTLFDPTKCVIDQGIIYDAVIEANDEYILLMTCNGDKEKIFNNGVSVYMPAGGGEYYSYRVEEL